MRKIAVITGDLFIGGTGKSLISFLDFLANKFNMMEIDLYCFNDNGPLIHNLPECVKIKKILSYGDDFNKDFLKKIINKSISLDFYYSFKNRYIQKKYSDQDCVKKIMKNSQKYSERYIKAMRNVKEKYFLAIAWCELIPVYYLTKKVIADHKIAFIHPNYKEAAFNSNIDEKYFRKMDYIFNVSEKNCNDMIQIFPHLKSKIKFMYNILNEEEIKEKANEKVEEEIYSKNLLNIITVCRLDNQSKAIIRTIKVFANLKEKKLFFRLIIVGDGPDKNKLYNEIDKYNLKDDIILVGEQDNPYKFIKKADLFILLSYYEGKPLVVDEALILKKPVLVTNYASACEQIRNGINGIIVENNSKAIENTLERIIKNPEILKTLQINTLNRPDDKMEILSLI